LNSYFHCALSSEKWICFRWLLWQVLETFQCNNSDCFKLYFNFVVDLRVHTYSICRVGYFWPKWEAVRVKMTVLEKNACHWRPSFCCKQNMSWANNWNRLVTLFQRISFASHLMYWNKQVAGEKEVCILSFSLTCMYVWAVLWEQRLRDKMDNWICAVACWHVYSHENLQKVFVLRRICLSLHYNQYPVKYILFAYNIILCWIPIPSHNNTSLTVNIHSHIT